MLLRRNYTQTAQVFPTAFQIIMNTFCPPFFESDGREAQRNQCLMSAVLKSDEILFLHP